MSEVPKQFATEDRNAREQAFHDEWAASIAVEDVMVDASWEAVTCPEHLWFRSKLGDVAGKRVLDLGCGAGEAAVWFAKQGALVVASDISPKFLDLVRRLAIYHGVQVETHLADADELLLGRESFDVVYAGNLLHHVDTEKTLDQIESLLRPGGIAVTWDPLLHNPLIKIYRRMASDVRTPDEHPLRMQDVRLFRQRFSVVEYECFWLASLWVFLHFFLVERVHPSKERFWKKIIREHQRLTPMVRRLQRLDRWIFKIFPFAKRFGWTIAFFVRKAA